jgi:hypothetical protein
LQVGSEPLPKASGWIPKDVVRLVQVEGVWRGTLEVVFGW